MPLASTKPLTTPKIVAEWQYLCDHRRASAIRKTLLVFRSWADVSRYFFHFAGRDRDCVGAECSGLSEARNNAIRLLGSYLADQPGYADEGHWRVTVEDGVRRPVLNIIVATVPVRVTGKVAEPLATEPAEG
jgi:hypothetical protein